MLRLSRLADYGIVILCQMAAGDNVPVSARQLSEQTRLSESAIMKILKLLVKAGIVASVRGSKGGYLLSGNPRHITVLDVVNAIDGQVSLTQCSHHPKQSPTACACEFELHCGAKQGFKRVNHALQQTLSAFTLEMFLAQHSTTQKDAYVIAG